MGTELPKPARAKLVLAFAAIYLLWGSTYLAMRLAIDTVPPFLMAGTRFLAPGSVLYLLSWRAGAASPVVALAWVLHSVAGRRGGSASSPLLWGGACLGAVRWTPFGDSWRVS